MKNIIFAAGLIIGIIVALPGMLSADNKKTPSSENESIDLIENAIIIDGLSLTSQTPPSAEAEQGDIIYDDNFIDEEEAVTKVITVNRKKIKNAQCPSHVISELKKKDSRWHLSAYTVRPGDNLWSIAKRFNTSHRIIVELNGINDPAMLKPGKKIQVPNRNGFEYTVKKGDTLNAVSRRFKADPSIVAAQNGSQRRLTAGRKIFIPDASAPVNAKKENNTALARRNNQPVKDATPVERDTTAPVKTAKTDVAVSNNFCWPLKGRITSGFGNRIDPFSRNRKFHNGIDISAELGTPVKAAASGTVIFSGWKDGYGNLVVLRHANGYISVYGHNRDLKKNEGDAVEKGEVIALSGMTGAVTGAHLHFEIQKYQTPLNPLRLIK